MTIVYIIAGVIIVIVLAMIIGSHHPMFKMTSQTLGRVVGAVEREVRDEVERREETVITVAYEIHGTPYTVEKVIRGKKAYKFPTGKKVEIRYNPAEPHMGTFGVG